MQTKYHLRHPGSPKAVENLSARQVGEGLRDGRWTGTDEVRRVGEEWQTLENHPDFAELVEELEEPPPMRREEPTHLDMNALIDVCLVLLIFFILTTTYAISVQKVVTAPTTREEAEELAEKRESKKGVKGVPAQGLPPEAKDWVRVKVEKVGGKHTLLVEGISQDVFDEKGTLDQGKLAEQLRLAVRGKKNEILLQAENISWGLFIAVQDAARSANIDVIHHEVIKKEPPSR